MKGWPSARGVLALFIAALGAQEPSPLPLTWENIFLENRGAYDAAISPNGRWVAVTATGARGRGIYLIPANPEGSPEATFWVAGSSPRWSPDSGRIVFLHANDLWIAEVGSQRPQRITSDSEDERAPAFAPDGKTIAFYSSRSGYQDIWLVEAIPAGSPRRLTREAMAEDDPRFAPAWSPDGRHIAFVSNKSHYWDDDIWVVEVNTGETRQLSHGLMATSTPVWSPDGRKLAVLGTSKNEFWYEDLSYIYVLDAVAGTERPLKMQIYATDWLMNHRPFWSGDGTQIYFLYQQRGEFDLWAVPSAGGVATRITNMGGAVRSFDATPAGDAFVVVRSTPTRGAEVDYISSRGGLSRQLSRFSRPWTNVREPAEISYRSYDGLYIQGFLYLPSDFSPEQTYPALVNVHGGGTNSYLNGLNLIEQHLAAKGYIVLAINYRGGSGFGREFQELSINDWANGQALDAAAAADFLRSLPYCNGKVGIYGYSYGGIMTMAAITRAPEKFDAAVSMAGIYDFGDAYRTADRLGRVFIRAGHGGSPEERPEIYAISNSLARIARIRSPLLIMHGEADVRAPFRQFRLAIELLRQHGKVFESKSYPDEPHGFRNPQNSIDMYQRLEAFFAQHLKASR